MNIKNLECKMNLPMKTLRKLVPVCILFAIMAVACNQPENKGMHKVLISADSLSEKNDSTQFYLPKNLYLVMLDMQVPKPALSLDEEIGFTAQRILPGFVYLDSLRKAGIPVFGGAYAVKGGCAFIIQADNNLQLQEILKKCPLTEVANATVLPLISFGESLFRQKENLKNLQDKQLKNQKRKGVNPNK
jgi:hypothetical protein